MPKSTSTFPVLFLVALALVITGCGGGSDDETSSAGGDTSLAKSNNEVAPDKAEFVKQAEAICNKSNTERFNEAVKYRKKYAKELDTMSPIPREEKIISAVVLPSVQKEAEELGELVPPKGDEKKIAEIVSLVEKGVKEAEKDPYSISFEVPSEYPFREAGLKIRAYGINDCRNIA